MMPIKDKDEYNKYRQEWRVRTGRTKEPREGHAGENNGRAKLTRAQVEKMRAEHAKGAPVKSLTRKSGVNNTTIYRALKKRTWKD